MKRFLRMTIVELTLSLRNYDTLIFGVIMPVVILVISGLVNRDLVKENFGAYISIGVCAIGLMGLPLTLSDYRDKGILKRLQVTPVSPGILLGIQVVVQTIMATISALITTLAAVLIFKYRLQGSLLLTISGFYLTLISIFSLGLLITSRAKDLKRAGLICSIIYFPMLLFSGTTIPLSVFPEIVKKIVYILPLRHGITVLNSLTLGLKGSSLIPEVGILVTIGIISIPIAVKSFKWHN